MKQIYNIFSSIYVDVMFMTFFMRNKGLKHFNRFKDNQAHIQNFEVAQQLTRKSSQ